MSEAHGSWINIPLSYGYQWQDCDSAGDSCTAISAATGQTYVVTASDVGHTIRVQETAADAAGAGTPASSAQTAVVKARSTGTPPPPETAATAAAIVGNQEITLTARWSGACVARAGRVEVTLGSSAIARSKAAKLKFSSAALYLDRGVKHTHRHKLKRANGKRKTVVVVSYSANAYTKTARKHGRRTTVTVTKALTVRFSVC